MIVVYIYSMEIEYINLFVHKYSKTACDVISNRSERKKYIFNILLTLILLMTATKNKAGWRTQSFMKSHPL